MAGKFIPSGQNGHVLLTTRARAVGPIAQRVDIEKMGPEEGALFLLRRAKGIANDTPLEAIVEVDRGSADEITSELGGLPLAMDQAASYIEETGCGFSGYLDLYRKYAPQLLGKRGELVTSHPDPVATTWVLGFEKSAKPILPQANSYSSPLFCTPMESLKKCFAKAPRNSGRSWKGWHRTPLRGIIQSARS
jgi:hypothetical protein